ncbi:hypothetical protein OPT61_g211 [Boeremia exigua]|uniref:Uncharacterized protein n=1 Tax=Boeremia exigua TaxID=749465 RepID=A0ACC2IUM0_9PLEO|nr:hypothetical protein OPT61_g211 [Boeremia exigua]
MRRNAASEPSTHDDHGAICPLLIPALDKLSALFSSASDVCQSTNVRILKVMLELLNKAVESYLGTNICFAALVLDEIDGHMARSAQEALRALGLRRVLGTAWASRSVVRAHPLSIYNGTDMDLHTVLAIDYSSSWFNVGLYTIEEIGLVDPVLGLVDGLKIGEAKQLEAFEETLRDVASKVPSDVQSPDTVFLYGDQATNREIMGIIESVSVRRSPVMSTCPDQPTTALSTQQLQPFNKWTQWILR